MKKGVRLNALGCACFGVLPPCFQLDADCKAIQIVGVVVAAGAAFEVVGPPCVGQECTNGGTAQVFRIGRDLRRDREFTERPITEAVIVGIIEARFKGQRDVPAEVVDGTNPTGKPLLSS
jgi:hypothetical protein